MTENILESLRWPMSIFKAFFKAFPLGTIASILLSFLGQIAFIGSMLLPLKVVMIMSSGNVPKIFPAPLTQFGEKPLLAALTALAIGVFIFYAAASRANEKLAEIGISKINKKNKKLSLFENENLLAENAYRNLSSAYASLFFVAIATAALGFFYWQISLFIIIYIFICAIFLSLLKMRSSTSKEQPLENLPKNLGTASNTGFLFLFFAIISDYIFFEIPGFISVLITLILGRQILGQSVVAVNGFRFLFNNKEKLKALFFHNEAFIPPSHTPAQSPWRFLENSELQTALNNLLQEIEPNSSKPYNLEWYDTGLNGFIFLLASCDDSSSNRLLIKIFGKQRSSEARHEAQLLTDAPEGLPAPSLIRASNIEGFHLHIFDIDGYKLTVEERPKVLRERLESSLYRAEPDTDLLNQYQRSRPLLWDRINETLIHKFHLIGDEHQQSAIAQFESLLPDIKQQIMSLPLVFTNFHPNPRLYAEDSHQNLISLHWGTWSLAPVASASALESQDTNGLHRMIERLNAIGGRLSELEEQQLKLSIGMGQIDGCAWRQMYGEALRELQALVDSWHTA